MNKSKNKYRISLYLGKENYERLEPIATMMNMSVSTLARIIFDTGMQITKQLETNMKGAITSNGKSQNA